MRTLAALCLLALLAACGGGHPSGLAACRDAKAAVVAFNTDHPQGTLTAQEARPLYHALAQRIRRDAANTIESYQQPLAEAADAIDRESVYALDGESNAADEQTYLGTQALDQACP